MRKFVFFTTLFALALTSCISSPEDKANKLIEQHIKACLYKPDTYEFVYTKIDSAFTPYCDPAFHEKILKFGKLFKKLESYANEMAIEEFGASSAKSSMTMHSDDYSAYSRNEYQTNKKEYQEHLDNIKTLSADADELSDKMKKVLSNIQADMQKEPEFIGYKAVHRYRAKDNDDKVLIGDTYFLFDKDFKEIKQVYDVESLDFKIIDQAIKQLKENKEEELE